MDIFLIPLIILIIVAIILIIVQIVNNYCDNTLIKIGIDDRNDGKYSNLKIDKIGITRSVTFFFPDPTSSIYAHTDIIMKCYDPKSDKYKFIVMYEGSDDPRAAKNINGSHDVYINLKSVKLDKKFNFKLDCYNYRVTNMFNTNGNWTVGEVYELYKEVLTIPYHKIKFNCHHLVNLIIEIVIGKHRDHKINGFEFDNTDKFKPLKYVCGYLKEKIGLKAVDKMSIDELKKMIY